METPGGGASSTEIVGSCAGDEEGDGRTVIGVGELDGTWAEGEWDGADVVDPQPLVSTPIRAPAIQGV